MRVLRPTLLLLLLLVGELFAVVGLHRLGRVEALALPASDWSRWLATSAPADVVMAVLRLLALQCAWWLLLSTLLYAAARFSRIPQAISAVEWATLPVVRRAADRAIAVAMAAATTVGSGGIAVAGTVPLAHHEVAQVSEVPFFPPGDTGSWNPDSPVVPPPVFAPAEVRAGAGAAGDAGSVVLPPSVAPPESAASGDEAAGGGGVPAPPGLAPAELAATDVAGSAEVGAAHAATRHALPRSPAGVPLLPPALTAGTVPPPVHAPDEPPAAAATETRNDDDAPAGGTGEQTGHRIVSGEHLWRIAAEAVAAARGITPDQVAPRDVHRYWVTLITANEGVISSGDPDLVFPGERLVLPPVD